MKVDGIRAKRGSHSKSKPVDFTLKHVTSQLRLPSHIVISIMIRNTSCVNLKIRTYVYTAMISRNPDKPLPATFSLPQPLVISFDPIPLHLDFDAHLLLRDLNSPALQVLSYHPRANSSMNHIR